MEKILNVEVDVDFNSGKYSTFSGVRVTTDKHVYEAGIYNQQSCCEDWGYVINEDKDASSFIGANLNFVRSDGTFTNFETDRGTLNFTAYNEHNGYYSHSCVLKRDEEIIEEAYL